MRQSDRDAAEAANDQGAAREEQGALADAIPCYERAISLDPTLAIPHHNLGTALLRLGREREAIAPLRRALALQPNFGEALNSLGAAQQAIGALDEAIASYRKAIAVVADFAEAHCSLGTALCQVGELDEALLHFQTAVELAPRNARFHRYLVDFRVGPVPESHLRQMEELANELESLTIEHRIELHFALGKAYAGHAKFDSSFEHLHGGNALRRSITDYDEAGTLQVFEALPRMFNRRVIEAMAGSGHPSRAPIFIFGMPRSGTTLVEQILAGHPEVYAAGELTAFEIAMQRFAPVDVDPNETHAFAAALSAELRSLGERYVRDIEMLSSSAVRTTDKMPWNFRFAGLIYLALPNARMIHVQRDPLDTCLSCFSTLFAGPQPYAYDLVTLGRYYRAYEHLMTHWRESIPESAMLEIRYEELVDDFERHARRIVEHCGLAWHDACRDFSAVKRPIRTASAVAVRQPLYRGAIGRSWAYRKHLGPLLKALAT